MGDFHGKCSRQRSTRRATDPFDLADTKPTPIHPEFENFPAELKSLPNWVLWRYLTPKSNAGKWRKVPFQPNKKPADTTDRSTWSAFEACYAAYAPGGFDGVGFVFDGEIGADGLCYCGVDLDSCIENGEVQSLARSRIKRLKTYTECSVSGTGFHCIVRAKPLDRVVKFDGVEIYTKARYFTFTGRSFWKIKAAPTEICALVNEVRAKEAAVPTSGKPKAALSYNAALFPQQPIPEGGAQESLADGIKNTWFETLFPKIKTEVIDYALGVVAKNTRLLELEADGGADSSSQRGNNAEYYKLATSVARSGAPDAEDIFVKHASSAKNADPDEALRQHFLRCRASQPSGNREITVGTLLLLAQQNGANFDQWKCQAVPDQKNVAQPGVTEIKIDWSKVKSTGGWLKSVADLPDDAPAKLKHIIGHTGNLKDLNEDLIKLGLLRKGYRSWSDVTQAIAADFKFYGKYTPEQIAKALLADLPCNQYIAKQPDKERAIEQSINRSHDPKPKTSVNGHWPDGQDDQTGKPKKGILNTIEAIKRAGITCTWDEFRQKEYWAGHDDKNFDGEVSDGAVTVTRRNLKIKFRLYPEPTETRDAITDACHDNKSNPVLDYFAGLNWDGKPRLDKMFHSYWGADDTPLNAAIGRKVICAIVRRAKRPGCKFDHQLVLQSPQGRKKSMFCEDLAVFSDIFTDAGDLSGTIKEQTEIIQGMQIIEFPELAGHSRATRERNKASLSRKNDRARLSYAHYATNQPRQSIPIATTNEGHYLNDPTGERRYWHVAVTFYDRDAFLAEKDQLYAEAVAREPAEKLWLDAPELEAAHDAIVATVKAPNELVDMLADLHGEAWHVDGKDEERVSTADIRHALGMTEADAVRSHNIGQRIADAMKTLGWTKAPGTLRCHKDRQPTTGFIRPLPNGPPKAPVQPAQALDHFR